MARRCRKPETAVQRRKRAGVGVVRTTADRTKSSPQRAESRPRAARGVEKASSPPPSRPNRILSKMQGATHLGDASHLPWYTPFQRAMTAKTPASGSPPPPSWPCCFRWHALWLRRRGYSVAKVVEVVRCMSAVCVVGSHGIHQGNTPTSARWTAAATTAIDTSATAHCNVYQHIGASQMPGDVFRLLTLRHEAHRDESTVSPLCPAAMLGVA